MGFKVAVVGKGGVGKTTIAGTLARLLARSGFDVFAIDVDPSMNLHTSLGIPKDVVRNITPISEMSDLVEERTGAKPGSISGVFILNPKVSDLPDRFKVIGPDGVKLLVAGTVVNPGRGCMCPSNALVRALISHLILKREEAVILDMEAGVEHLGRGTARNVDAMLIIVEPGAKSITLAEKIKDLALRLGIKHVFLVGNKISSNEERRFLEDAANRIEIEIAGYIPYDRNVIDADLADKALLDYAPGSPAVQGIKDLHDFLIRRLYV
ncbi:MAG: AAA family ATPase [Candidatus Freyarchaeota archaeon]|nr:AAA family ATPase [Candidatus Jordarchaeia archaeon]